MDTKITDNGLMDLANARYLNNLSIANCFDVTVGGVKSLCDKNKNLGNLNFAYIKYDGTPFDFILEQKSLKHLNVMGLPITDSDLETISKSKSINSLNIENGNITDRGVAHLNGKNYKNLSIHNCRNISQKAVESLRESLPKNCAFMTDVGSFSRFGRSDTGDFKTIYKRVGEDW